MEFSRALESGAIHIPRGLLEILNEVFNVEHPLASGLAVALGMDKNRVEEAVKSRRYLFEDTSYLLVDDNSFPERVLWLKTVYVYTNEETTQKNMATPSIIDPMPCRRLYGDPIALDELVVCTALRPLIGKELYIKALIFRTRKKIIDVDVEGLCRGITSYARKLGGVTVYLPVLLRSESDRILGFLQSKRIDPEFLRSGDIEPLVDVVRDIVGRSLRLAGLVQ